MSTTSSNTAPSSFLFNSVGMTTVDSQQPGSNTRWRFRDTRESGDRHASNAKIELSPFRGRRPVRRTLPRLHYSPHASSPHSSPPPRQQVSRTPPLIPRQQAHDARRPTLRRGGGGVREMPVLEQLPAD